MNAPRFSFIDFDAHPDLQEAADLAMERITDHAPYGARPVATLTRLASERGVEYRCAVELHTRYGPFAAHAQRSDAMSALLSAEHAILAKLRRWARNRPVAFLSEDGPDLPRSA